MLDLKTIGTSGALRLVDAGGGVGVLEIDVPGRSVNVLTSTVLADLERALGAIAGDPAVKALVVTGGKAGSGTFIAGADIDEIRSVTDPTDAAAKARKGQEILAGFARMEKPTVAAINGKCLGGGTELVLACDLRIAADSPKVEIGLPEVLLGIIPGFGGTQRLPHLVGIQPALGLILTGKAIDARRAAKMGLVDRVVPPVRLREEAVKLAAEALTHGKRWRPGRKRKGRLAALLLEKTGWGRSFIRRTALKRVRSQSGGNYPAAEKAVEAVIAGFPKPLEDGLRLEAELVGGLVAGEVAKSLMGLFQESERLRRGPREDRAGRDEPAPKPALPRRVVVLGAGVMGGSIAALLARRGFRVRLKDIRDEALSTALQQAAKSFDDLVRRKRITRRERQNLLAALSATTGQSGFRGAELALEAVVEDLEVKRQVLREVEPLLGPDTLFASNTSALSITALAEAATRPERVVGIHFFNPVHRMPLIEVVRGVRTSEDALREAERFAREIGKYPVRVKDSPGFLVNRLLMPYLNEAAHLLSEGKPLEAIDQSLREFGFPMGPFELLDEVGLDVAAKVAHILHQAFGERAAPAPLLLRLTGDKKLLGKKSGAGFYLHQGKRRRPNHRVLRMVPRTKTEPTAADRAAWQRRTVYPMINEAARCLEEGVVASAGEVNVATVMGMAFPPFRGGLLAYADRVGPAAIAGELTTLASAAGSPAAAERYRPAALLSRLASEGRTFASLPRREESPEAQPAEEAAFSAGS